MILHDYLHIIIYIILCKLNARYLKHRWYHLRVDDISASTLQKKDEISDSKNCYTMAALSHFLGSTEMFLAENWIVKLRILLKFKYDKIL